MGITRDEALDCLRSDDLLGIGMEADSVRRTLHPEGVVTYAIGASMDLKAVLHGTGYTDTMTEQLRPPIDAGATGVRLRSLAHIFKALGFPELLQRIRTLRDRFPSVWLETTPGDIQMLAQTSRIEPGVLISQLQQTGLDGIGAEYVATADHSSDWSDWLPIYHAAHRAGMPTVASLTFGVDTSIEQRVEQLVRLHELQSETGGFVALTAVAAPPAGGRELDGVTAVERLKMLATARMLLDNILHVQAMPSAHGLKVLQTSLCFGANDLGWILPVAGKSDSPHDAPEEDIRRIIRDAGFTPAERDARYRAMIAV